MGSPAFSDRGEAPTDFERMLVDQYGDEDPRHVRQLWVLIARRIGVAACAVVLDEIGGMSNLSAPTRRTFFGELYHRQRDEEIQRRMSAGEPSSQVARDMGLDGSTVRRIAAAKRVRHASNRDTSARWNKRSNGGHTR